ncbi:MAG: enoyl-CoA hydratase/isomerase family protein [Pseudomonadales bacterium]|jgi:enoyl-CoA hydratase/carnithine racemase|nr:enoyl-CoA hydratase/isomerase family protein [Pseudomonadales bacterium]MDP7358831.1 enoyl-CoA hydratase/isomerase family protein [Pseudomonadales bacterium]MDP7594389.1 enoyl-CoA hydratase/isomerase family protein [Pseudomonadales bacterium]HJN49056.1 enoyl-CoA hydratase/isomerase family protein [Pseudomonadales bacterium]
MAHEMIKTEVVGRVGVITHDRPEKLNALHPVMSLERQEQIEAWNEDPAIGAIVVTGAGRAFCSGADVGGWKRDLVDPKEQAPQPAASDDDAPRLDPGGWTRFCMQSKPLIAAINGPAIGAGLTTILPFDVRIASDRATLSMRFIRMGIFPELGSTHILPHIVGMGHAMELMLTGRIIDGEESARIGLVNRVVPHDQLMEKAMEVAAEIAFNPIEQSRGVKEVTWKNLDEDELSEVQRLEGVWLRKARTSKAFGEAVNAFLDKRQPDFHNLQ